MKKTYQKPGICIEKFVLSQNVALSCGWRKDYHTGGYPTHADQLNCGWHNDTEDVTIWVQSPACNELESADFPYYDYCYNNPDGQITVFAS